MTGEIPVKNEEDNGGKNSLLRDAIELEIDKEKKKIREEIIAAEIIRRRKLEAEVRMELMMEEEIMGNSVDEIGQKMNLVGGTDDDSLQIKSNVLNDDHVASLVGAQFAGKSMADFGGNEQQVLGQAMPSSGISGMKRKAETSVAGSDEETASVASKDLQKKKWNCSLCGVSATSAGGLNLHLHGKKHKAKEAVTKSGDTASINSTENNSVENSRQPMEQALESLAQFEEEEQNQEQPMEEEKTKVQSMEEEKINVQPMEEEKSQVTKKWECSLCQISATSEILLHSHLQGKKHKAKEARLGVSQGMRTETDKGKNENIHKWYCSLCQVSAASEKNLNDHYKGKKHKAKAGLAHQEDGNGDSDSVFREKSLESEEGLNNEEVTNESMKPGKSQASEQEIVNTLNTVKIGKDRDKAETEELKKSGYSQEMNGKPVKLWHCKMCNEGTYDEATMANHRKSSKHMKLLREIGGGLIVVSNVPKEAVEGEQGSQDAAVEC
ncbi:cilia- and flagella-associated protein 251-like isoform X2 [Chenopodium quinoa]|uniref:cilia- and flagella-associated protein 251-like isoform X2 n=1 Tax=Chenopodium quinoa TaxID=63459 RepID=UPI000B77011E|nr:cilia- and flagella-associated protein 251-like isoform X2 [Chenopodium quinoa]